MTKDVAIKLIRAADAPFYFDRHENRVVWIGIDAVVESKIVDDEGMRTVQYAVTANGDDVLLESLRQTRAEAEIDAARWHQSEMMRFLGGAPIPEFKETK